MSFAGGDVTRLTSSVGIEGPPAISHDGSTIAFFRRFDFGGGVNGIYKMSSSGTSETRILATADAGEIAFDPDGTRIAFVNLDPAIGPTNEIFFVNVDGTGLQQFTSGAGANSRGLDWSPDGNMIAFVSFTPTAGVYFVPAAGGPRQRIVDGEEPSFSPGGSTILYRRNVSGNWRYFANNLNGTTEQAVLILSGVNRAVFHPNGTSLIFDRATPRSQIYLITGSGQTTNLSNNAFEDRFPAVRGSP